MIYSNFLLELGTPHINFILPLKNLKREENMRCGVYKISPHEKTILRFKYLY
jgi:hypothetical protein